MVKKTKAKNKLRKKKIFLQIILILIVMGFVSAYMASYTWSDLIVKSLEEKQKSVAISLIESGWDIGNTPDIPVYCYDEISESFGTITAMQMACRVGSFEVISKLLRYYSNPNAKGTCDDYPINIILREYDDTDYKIAKKLISNNANVNLRAKVCHLESERNTLLLAASLIPSENTSSQVEITKIYKLIEKHSKNIDPVSKTTGENALLLAARAGDLELVKYLIEKKQWDINFCDKDGRNALFVKKDTIQVRETLKYLISRGIDKQACDNYGMTASSYAFELGNNEICDIIDGKW